ncbi:MAG: ATP-binding protein [Pseudanabaena sp. ELA748]
MTNTPDSEYRRGHKPSTEIEQKVIGNEGQAIAQMIGGIAVGQLTVYLSNIPTEPTSKAATTPSDLGENPYQGLKAFREADGDRFFGRDDEIQNLLDRFKELNDRPNAVRVLPIYGPSGSGKSSLARAGLIPALGKQPLRGKDRCRVVVLTPGERPLEALATVLARIAENDLYPVTKMRQFHGELINANSNKEFDGLRCIASIFPDINFSPLIILVDQFEEIYTYQPQPDDSIEKIHELEQERFAFVQNLLCAARDRSQNVSVILTLRSDFLGKTQQNPQLNKLFATQGVLVPIMQPDQLAIAITEPAKRAGYTIDKATVNLLIKESQGQEGALPLLQFALMQIWEGLLHEPRVTPAETLEKIGGVGGALASEAKRLYESLTPEQQQIARSAFLSMVQLNDDNKETRRRATISELVKDASNKQLVREVIECFAKPGVWILVTSASKDEVELVEIAHEALINNWKELKVWLDLQWESLIKKRKIEDAALDWNKRNKSKDYLLQGRILRDAKEFQKAQKDNPETSLSVDAKEFMWLLRQAASPRQPTIFSRILLTTRSDNL